MISPTPNTSLIESILQKRAKMLESLCEDRSFLEGAETLLLSCIKTIETGGKIILCGNGGFAAISQHTVSELVGKLRIKRNPIPAIALGTDMAVLTCIANDFGYERIFSRQLEAIGKKNDVVIALTTSGKSKNILQVLSQAKTQGIPPFVITGNGCGRNCEELGATVIEILTNETEAIQDGTMILLHIICKQLEEQFYTNKIEESSSIWYSIIDAGKKNHISTLILDRDGVVNHILPNDYILSDADLILNTDFLAVSSVLKETFEKIFIVTNQACIGKGLADKERVDRINHSIRQSIMEAGGRVDAIYTCPDTDELTGMRKPNVGVANLILKDFPDLDISKSIMVGDSYSDELFAQRLGAIYFNISNI